MHSQRFDLIPHHLAGVLAGGQVNEYIRKRTFIGFGIQEIFESGDGPKWKGNNSVNETEWRCDDPPYAAEKITHLFESRFRWGLSVFPRVE